MIASVAVAEYSIDWMYVQQKRYKQIPLKGNNTATGRQTASHRIPLNCTSSNSNSAILISFTFVYCLASFVGSCAVLYDITSNARYTLHSILKPILFR